MKSKLKVKKIVDSFLSKDDVGFYKVEWEESWLPMDAFQHLKYLIEEFWKHKKISEEKSEVSAEEADEKNEETNNKEVTSIAKREAITSEDEDKKSACYFCEERVSCNDLDAHEHEHIQQNCSQVLINLIGESKNENFMLIKFDEGSPSVKEAPKSVSPPSTTGDITKLSFSTSSTAEVVPTMTIHHRSNNESSGLSCPVCNEKFKLFNEFVVHFETHRNNPRYFFCDECGKQFVSKELFEKHTQLHKDSNRRQRSYGDKISSFKSGRKAIRRIIYPRLYQTVDSLDKGHSRKEQLIDLSQSPFGSLDSSGEYSSSGRSQQVNETNKMFVEMLETNRYRKRARKEAAEFSPDVLRSARQYIKAVSKRRKVIKRSRLLAQEEAKESSVGSLVDGIGVDVELERSEDSLPILSVIDSKQAYSCKVCSKTFFNKFHHREHYNVHSGEMPYECEFCLKRFAQRSGWNRHIKLHHKYDVFAGPLPRGALEKLNEKDIVFPSNQSPILATRVTMAEPSNFNVHKYIPTEIRPKSGGTTVTDPPQSNPTSDAGKGNPITALTRLTYDSHSPFPYQYDKLPDTVRCVLQTGITPPSFTAVAVSQSVVMTETTATKVAESIPTSSAKHSSSGKTTAFQCKKVRTMNGDLIFMIRVSEKKDCPASNKEFAYILDDAGFVESRIFVDDYPGGDWLDFPLDETANDVLRSRVHDYDEQNRRGPKPAHLATNRKQLSKAEYEEIKKKETASENVRSFMKASRPISTKDLVAASSLIFTTVSAGEAGTHLALQKATHGRSFRSGREKRFSCNICERKFLAQAHLNDHMLIHTGELPYKCMFCNRPFRHKSGLNSHHKRHIQRGVFNRPISSKDKVIYPAGGIKQSAASIVCSTLSCTTTSQIPSDILRSQHTENPSHSILNSSAPRLCPPSFLNADVNNVYPPTFSDVQSKEPCEKQKRKGRKPKQVIKTVAYSNGEEFVPKLEDDSNTYQMDDDQQSNEDIYECNFCSMTFPIRTAYLKHVHRLHKASNTSEVGELNEIYMNSEENKSGDYDGLTIKQETFDETNENVSNGVVENLFPDVTIKEEVIDNAYEGLD